MYFFGHRYLNGGDVQGTAYVMFGVEVNKEKRRLPSVKQVTNVSTGSALHYEVLDPFHNLKSYTPHTSKEDQFSVKCKHTTTTAIFLPSFQLQQGTATLTMAEIRKAYPDLRSLVGSSIYVKASVLTKSGKVNKVLLS